MSSITRDSSGALHLGGVRLEAVAASVGVGTPAYVYDLDAIAAEARDLQGAFGAAAHLVAYALKANTAGGVVRALAAEGCGADVVSGAELLVALACGIPPERVVFSGVAKTDAEIDRAIQAGIAAIQIESLEEIARVQARAASAGRTARVSLRINPSVDLEGATHAHIATGHDKAKFGVPRADVVEAVRLVEAATSLQLVGMTMHAGSQFTDLSPYVEGARVLLSLVRSLRESGRARSLAFVSTGGGFGVDYAGSGAPLPRPADFVAAVRAMQREHGLGDLALYVEPGRSMVAPHGVLLARVIQAKVAAERRWLMIDAGMNDLLRPALYQARHRIVPLDRDVKAGQEASWRVVGPVCESSDDFGEHALPLEPPGAVAILDVGAYGFTMASVYNGRQVPVEVFLRGGRISAVTERASVESWAAARARAGA
jgi:diaminopimelate decarboxylase